VLFTSQNTGSSVLLSLTKTTKDLRLQQVYADAEEICFVLEYVLKNSTNSSRTLESTRTVFQIRKPSQIISHMIIIGWTFFAISLTISSDHLAQSALVAHFVQFL
jgi:hypothetical protein